MIIGCPSEIKTRECRVGIIPASVHELVAAGHTVLVQRGAGVGSGITDDDFAAAGARIVDAAPEVWAEADIVCKVKEPLPAEFGLMREGQIVYTYLHLAAAPDLTRALVDRRVTGIAYETIQVGATLPLLKPMSEVAGKMSVQVGAWCLEREHGGKGVLLGGVDISSGRQERCEFHSGPDRCRQPCRSGHRPGHLGGARDQDVLVPACERLQRRR